MPQHRAEPGDQPGVLGDVVGLLAQRRGALPEHPAAGSVTDERAVPGDPGVAPRPAVGLDDELRTRPPAGSEAGLGRAHEDAAALLAAQHLVGRRRLDAVHVDVVELELAAAAAALAQRRRAEPTALRRGSCRRGRPGRPRPRPRCRPAARRPRAASASSSASAASRAARRLGHAARSSVARSASSWVTSACGVLGALHHLELDVLQLGLPAGQRRQLVLERLEVLGGAGARSRAAPGRGRRGRGRAARRPRPWRPRAGCRRARSGPAPARCPAPSACRLELGEPGALRQALARVRDLVETGVDRLQVEQSPLTGRVGFQDVPPGPWDGSAPTTKSHGSVRSVEMWVSTLEASSPPVATSAATQPLGGPGQPQRLGRPVARVDEVGRPAAGLLARLEHGVVAQVGGDVDVGPAGPDVRRTGRRRRRPSRRPARTRASAGPATRSRPGTAAGRHTGTR